MVAQGKTTTIATTNMQHHYVGCSIVWQAVAAASSIIRSWKNLKCFYLKQKGNETVLRFYETHLKITKVYGQTHIQKECLKNGQTDGHWKGQSGLSGFHWLFFIDQKVQYYSCYRFSILNDQSDSHTSTHIIESRNE